MYAKVLLALDGSTLARSAIPHAAHVAAPGVTVVVLHVVPTVDAVRRDIQGSAYEFTMGGERSVDELTRSTHFAQRNEAIANLESAKRLLGQAGVSSVQTMVREGYPGNEILDAAAEQGCDVIVMATRGHSGLGREVIGSVAEYVLRHAGNAAVLLVGPRTVPGLAVVAEPSGARAGTSGR
ncbi:MAG: universal stress protein [Chloroflexi bacterium]|nr:universal stress protein [Chloroflexota bacterium]